LQQTLLNEMYGLFLNTMGLYTIFAMGGILSWKLATGAIFLSKK